MLALLAGCAQTRSYQVRVTNHTDEPITFGLVKEGGPIEPEWAPPELAAANDAQPSAAMWGAIPPGKTAGTNHPITGKFDRGSRAVLRVYQGNLSGKLAQILAINRDAPNRVDVQLHPGMNQVTITQNGERLIADTSRQ